MISKTLVYGALTVLLGAAYVGLVLAGQALFSSFAGGSNLAIAVSTLVVAALFLPMRSRVQRHRRPPLLPAPLRRAADARDVRRPAARADRPRHARARPPRRRQRDDAAGARRRSGSRKARAVSTRTATARRLDVFGVERRARARGTRAAMAVESAVHVALRSPTTCRDRDLLRLRHGRRARRVAAAGEPDRLDLHRDRRRARRSSAPSTATRSTLVDARRRARRRSRAWAALLRVGRRSSCSSQRCSSFLLLFPDGRLPTRRWRVVLWGGTVGLLLVPSSAVAVQPGRRSTDYPQLENPVGDRQPAIVDVARSLPGFVALLRRARRRGRLGRRPLPPLARGRAAAARRGSSPPGALASRRFVVGGFARRLDRRATSGSRSRCSASSSSRSRSAWRCCGTASTRSTA